MRDLVFKVIFQNEFRNDSIETVLEDILHISKSGLMKADITRYVKGIYENLPSIDEKISLCLENWSLQRLSLVDRSILRLATYELLYESDVPIEVTLDEAVEIAKKYGTENSSKFVNGVLDKVAKSFAPEEKRYI
ncbi:MULTISPECIES: transcription antitermination factor NusB [Pseudothermotoga]|jgi:N utilization substance protein B|nr:MULTISPECIES: transcription antitermination factor NusB [Pseudothermotoga]KUK20067.1 MAG: N utilization substance protein B-like protein [Pseudothermotoga lettingae]MDI3494687.1 transcription antitermination protein NusB [Pseudothermotoga sp.]MDK2884693.1 transcription antitermination protein NusB [Pseudothermotoga sp.]